MAALASVLSCWQRSVAVTHRSDRRADRLPALHAATDAGGGAGGGRGRCWPVPAGFAFGATKQIIGLFLAVYLMANIPGSSTIANQPVRNYADIPHLHARLAGVDTRRHLVVLGRSRSTSRVRVFGARWRGQIHSRLTKHRAGRVSWRLTSRLR